ncbi:PREDICTED: uncharacterized protein LOC102020366 [Chinchilla lanigera]|uniref:uncharacterized protein LOC102020366 n=1 Tax=Chinchilla lanigera TaxID=34839 RepID=UPI00038EF6E6|nr:PREDICTED: uncharacterized protein LOC102020366 [Chinchilla lanigera]
MLRRGAGAWAPCSRRPRRAASAARCPRRGPTRIGDSFVWVRGSHKQLPPKPGKWLDDWSLLLALRWKGGDSLKCVRGRRAPGNPEAWIPAESGTESAPLARLSLLPPARPPAPTSPRLRPALRVLSLRRRPLRLLSSSFASSSSSGFFSSSSSSFFSSFFSSSSSFPSSSPSATASSSTSTTPSGAPGSLQIPRPVLPHRGPLDPEPAALEPVGQTDGQTRRFLSPCALPLLPAAARVGGAEIARSSARIRSHCLWPCTHRVLERKLGKTSAVHHHKQLRGRQDGKRTSSFGRFGHFSVVFEFKLLKKAKGESQNHKRTLSEVPAL